MRYIAGLLLLCMQLAQGPAFGSELFETKAKQAFTYRVWVLVLIKMKNWKPLPKPVKATSPILTMKRMPKKY